MTRAFEYQSPTPDHILKIQGVRQGCRDLEEILLSVVPPSAERTPLALRHLQEVMFFSNTAIVFNGEKLF